jgi:hypothetical protein
MPTDGNRVYHIVCRKCSVPVLIVGHRGARQLVNGEAATADRVEYFSNSTPLVMAIERFETRPLLWRELAPEFAHIPGLILFSDLKFSYC